MAKIDIIDGDNYINVHAPVGPYAALNQPDDVRVVQALLKFINMGRKSWSEATVPEPDGTYTKRLGALIEDYQRQNNKIKEKPQVAIDQRVSPARGKAQYGYRQVWTIIAMNNDAAMVAAALGLGDYIDEICSRWPQVKEALKK
jgi:hypothetical protein